MKKLNPVPICNVNFFSENAIKKYKNNKGTNGTSFPGTTIESTLEEKNQFLAELASSQRQPITLHTFSDHCEQFIPASRAAVPPSLRNLFSDKNLKIVGEELEAMAKATVAKITVSAETVDYISQVTRKQSAFPIWHEMRTGRITASVAHDVLHTKMSKPAKSLILKICQESKTTTSKVPSLRWGNDHEKVALEEYCLILHTEHSKYEIKECGLKLYQEFPFIGASPDGIFTCTCHKSEFLIEIKCPYSKRDTESLEEAIDSMFFLDKEKQLKTDHKYFTQIQLQLFIFGMHECKLVVWTPKWMYHTTVLRNDGFIDSMLVVLKQFTEKNIVPELMTRQLEHGLEKPKLLSDSKSYCICNSKHSDTETWIGCDAVDCKREWFHLSCLKLKRIPKGIWYCKECRKAKKLIKK